MFFKTFYRNSFAVAELIILALKICFSDLFRDGQKCPDREEHQAPQVQGQSHCLALNQRVSSNEDLVIFYKF